MKGGNKSSPELKDKRMIKKDNKQNAGPCKTKRKYLKMKKIILTVTMALAMLSTTNAMNVSNASMAAARLNAMSNDSMKYEMILNDKIDRIQKTFHLDAPQKENIFKLQNTIAENFELMNKIEDDDTRNLFMGNLMNYWKKESLNAFAMTNRDENDWLPDYKKYWKCAKLTVINKNFK